MTTEQFKRLMLDESTKFINKYRSILDIGDMQTLAKFINDHSEIIYNKMIEESNANISSS